VDATLWATKNPHFSLSAECGTSQHLSQNPSAVAYYRCRRRHVKGFPALRVSWGQASKFGQGSAGSGARQRLLAQDDGVCAAKTGSNVRWAVDQAVGKDWSRQERQLVGTEMWKDEARGHGATDTFSARRALERAAEARTVDGEDAQQSQGAQLRDVGRRCLMVRQNYSKPKLSDEELARGPIVGQPVDAVDVNGHGLPAASVGCQRGE
jgi:hypothetical protein